MSIKVNLDEIKNIPQDEFKEILHSWMDQKDFTQSLQKKLRKQLVTDFQKTELAKRLETDKQKNLFNSKEYVIDTLQAEHLYSQNNHFTLSIFFTETQHPTLLPNFEQQKTFRFETNEIRDLMELLGITRTDKLTRRILNSYKSSNESLLSIVLKELINSRSSTDTRSVGIQTEINSDQQPLDISLISTKSKSKRPKRGRNHGLLSQEFKKKKPKKVKEVTVIANNLEKMSSNISIITTKLDEFKRNPNRDESKTIIDHVGTIMGQLNGCISNFETLCHDIKQINETRNRNYDEWMDDLQNSENGRRFVRKLQKSFARVVNEEKSKIQRDFRKKLEREKSKFSKLQRGKDIASKPNNYPETISKEINEIFQNTCMMIKNVDKESELFEKSLEIEAQKTKLVGKSKRPTTDVKTKTAPPGDKLNLNDCRQIHSTESSSVKSDPPRYGSMSFEDDDSNENN